MPGATAVEDLLRAATTDPPFQTSKDVLTAAGEIVARLRTSDPDLLRAWLWDNATMLMANQVLSRSVQSLAARADVPDRVRQAIGEWRDLPGARRTLGCWFETERPLLIRAWFHAFAPEFLEAQLSTFDSAAAAVVDAQVSAYNAHDIEGFLATYAEDAEVVTPRSTHRGRDALRAAYAPLFAERTCRAQVVARLAVGNSVVDLEVAIGVAPTPVRVLMAYRVAGTAITAAHTIAVQRE